MAEGAEVPQTAGTNFHDIKPLPEFSPIPWDTIWLATGLTALALLLYVLYRRRKRRSESEPVIPPLSPLEAALAEIARLEEQRRKATISLRDYASLLSLALRTYVEQILSFPAAEQTASEVYQSLPQAAKRRLPLLPADHIREYSSSVRSVLRFLEAAAFAGDSTERLTLESEQVRAAGAEAERLVRELDGHSRREEDRTRSVMSGEAPQ